MIRRIYNVAALLLITAATAVAQDATTTTTDPATIKNKKGEAYLPVADEWALGVSATPFLGYLGNFMNGNLNNGGPSFNYASNPAAGLANNVAVFGKKMIDANTAYRVRFNLSVNNTINKAVVAQDLVNPVPGYPAFADDWQKVNTTNIVIAPGWEKRRGSTRLQGIYGGELVLAFNATSVKYDYGNAMTSDFQTPTTTNFGTAFGPNLPGGGARVTEAKRGGSFLVGARAFIGVEYFFAPKMSIGGEFGYMLAYSTQRRNETTAQVFDSGTNAPREFKVPDYATGNRTNLGIGIDNLSGSINLLFYF